jgi:outer membrane receptor protein involved in Fe transport
LRDRDDYRLRLRGYVIDYDLDLLSNFTYFADDPVNGDQFQQIDDRIIYGGDISMQLGSIEQRGDMQQTFGTELRYDDIREVALNKTVNGEFLSTVRQDKVGEGSIGVYYENQFAWTDKLRSVVGLRYDYYIFDVESNISENSGNDDDGIFSPKLNLIYSVTDSTELYFNAGYGMHSNDARGVTAIVDPVSLDPIDPVDPLVQSKGAEVGGRTFLTDQISIATSVWYLELDSELLFVGDAGNTEALGPSQRYGIEVPIYYQTEFWKFDLEVALTHSEFSETGEDIPGPWIQ